MYIQPSIFEQPATNSHKKSQVFSIPDAGIRIYRDFFSPEESDELFSKLSEKINWKQEFISLYGKQVKLPRLTAWYGDRGKNYTYSRLTMQPQPWLPVLQKIKLRVEAVCDERFNSVLLNLYRNGQDSIAWHSDNEPELGQNPIIGSVSFGVPRCLKFRHKLNKNLKFEIRLTPGSFLLMQGTTQQYWQHQIPKARNISRPRINLTFRKIL